MKKILSIFLLLIFSLSTFGHSVGVVFAESQKETHCHESSGKSSSWDCCLISKDFSTQYSHGNIQTIKVLKFFGGDFLPLFQTQNNITLSYIPQNNGERYYKSPPSNQYTSLTGIIKQLK